MILVVGAGIAGLAAAIGLSRYGDVTLLERRSAVAANAGAGIQLAPNAVKSLQAIGAREAVEAAATEPAGLVIATAGRRSPTARLDYRQVMRERYGAPYWTISRDALHGALLKVALERPGITLTYDLGVARIDGEGIGWRTDGGHKADFVVVADGVGSSLRTALIGDRAMDAGKVAWRGTARDADPELTRLILAPSGHLVRYASGKGADNVVFVAPGRLQHPSAFPNRALRKAFEDVSGWTPWPIRVRRRHRYTAGSLAFVGDAAHAMPPFLAQGGAMALEDAAVLTAAVGAHGPTAEAGSAYADARRDRVRKLADLTNRQGGLYHLPEPLATGRDFVMRRLGPEGVLRRVDFIYRWAPPGL